MTRDLPVLSVVVSVHDGAASLGKALEALSASDLPRHRWELIVVDDGSTDDSPYLAAQYADAIVRLPAPSRGPAYARNRGAEMARSQNIVFLGTDVRVRPDTLSAFAGALAAHPDVTAVSAVCAPRQSASLATRYREGVARYAGEQLAEDALAFSPDCGAIRREAFKRAGMWDEWRVHRPRTEAADLGARLRALGCRLIVDRAIEVEHMQDWNAVSVIVSDLRDPGLQLAPLPAAAGSPAARRLRLRRRIDVAAVVSLAMAASLALVAAVVDTRLYMAAATAIVLTLLLDAAFYAVLLRRMGMAFTVSVIPLHLASSLAGGVSAIFAWLRQHVVGDPRPHPAVEAFAEVGVDTWPPVPRRRMPEPERTR